MPFYGSCNLGSINLNHAVFNAGGKFSFDVFAYVVKKCIRYLDLVGSANNFPTEKHKLWYENNRPVGLGIMGVADLFLRYKMVYGSKESIDFLEQIAECMYITAYNESVKLGQEYGIPEDCKALGRRNATLISLAPTGSIAMIADCSHVLEPIFSASFERTDERGETYIYTHPLAGEDYFVSAVGKNQPSWKEQIDLVAACQKWCDSGVSKTINLPNSATVEDVKQAFYYAWQNKLKGITIYRDGSRKIQVLNQVESVKEDDLKDVNCATGVCIL